MNQRLIGCLMAAMLVGVSAILQGSVASETGEETCSSAPRTLKQAVDSIVSKLDAESRKTLLETKREELIKFHLGWGMGIRNSMCLWGGNDELIRSACGGELCHPDTASTRIMEAVWDRVHGIDDDA